MSIVLTSTSGPDSKLHLEIPVDRPSTEFEVEVIVKPKSGLKKPMSQEEWEAFVLSTAGSIPDPTFERPEQLPFEVRDPL